MRIGLTPSDKIALSLHCDDQATANRSWLEDQADQGNAAASYLLARMLQSEIDLQTDDYDEPEENTKHQQIFQHLEKATYANHTMAHFYLARCYRDGLGVNENHTKAVELYRSLAYRGIPQAQIALGRCYENGDGVDQSYNRAIEWYSMAADQGSEDGRLHIVFLRGWLSFVGHNIEQSDVDSFNRWQEAVSIFEQLANEGHSDSQFWIAECYCRGKGVSEDNEKAFEWFIKSADQGNSYGQYWVGLCYFCGYRVTKDHTKAVEWYRKSAEQGNRYGQKCLGNCYQNGHGVPQNTDTAVFWWRKSADQGHQYSINQLKELGKWP
ncbi:uncharacterized protein BJ171DRAFT_444085 [Polychytrium aggregatum]|uniref:uncharacterized protein n=1 Tax=Polychytrium aggregatum TaxID=110093 RepID=UPI0022FE983E|nr:uncharacterized protein BJ171DRAFT_444085 [Polychytrium aggregatum]KAI9202895.1 hypothetical protein BJ171DRAFT_444085 [Polychytrium aggregatum]